ncbi:MULTISPECIES: cell division protein FtsX [unclassified Undibacterium]|uniref:cell division protein FtsX n=1 Tax=unclassified Undibacterium TaxID=2630295 RepID=UPI002AC8A78B|nr:MULTISPECIES: permease-like cell division protein FtsX [unclassified Undibacterium]MEB0139037.1 permease-like cell division protein FtsX [Undibacterium sp. CCC2.1]MEB0171868.1 permease-like cell division protein FtsX [Undibacterium sp. CCC1.1]MEB0175809.1 permease-like cell division protein FtsX [Undibacterium sp. CCC3.4]MEB0215125.1 permease-like cell division protein FtsX [Undibacterium sp. 5I2]WPX45092.1 permease-like cell division protein FtsX [Undibacterium sp. CCC3.4]
MTIWFREHLFALKSAFAHLRAGTGNFCFNVLVVAIALALPIAGLTLIDNIRPISSQLAIEPEISIFVTPDTPRASSTALSIPIKRLLKENGLESQLRFVPKEKALATMQDSSSLAEVLATLGGNPLPDAYILSLSNAHAEQLSALVGQLQALPDVDQVQIDTDWVKRLAALVQILQIALMFLAGTLALVVVVVVFNATRLQVISHQAEITITRLLGATNSFIHRPYYYTGALLGLLAGLLALAIIAASLQPLNQAIAVFAKLYASEFRLTPLPLWPSLGLLACSMVLGLAGAYLSVRRQLARAA